MGFRTLASDLSNNMLIFLKNKNKIIACLSYGIKVDRLLPSNYENENFLLICSPSVQEKCFQISQNSPDLEVLPILPANEIEKNL